MLKDSFSILETLLSLTLLSIIISGFFKITIFGNSSEKTFMLLNSLENKFDTSDYSNLSKSQKNLKIIVNNTDVKYINLFQHSYSDEEIKLVKYEK